MTYRGQMDVTMMRIIGKKSLTIKAKALKAELERLTTGRLELSLNQLISGARVLSGTICFYVSYLFGFSLFFYIFIYLLIYILCVSKPRLC